MYQSIHLPIQQKHNTQPLWLHINCGRIISSHQRLLQRVAHCVDASVVNGVSAFYGEQQWVFVWVSVTFQWTKETKRLTFSSFAEKNLGGAPPVKIRYCHFTFLIFSNADCIWQIFWVEVRVRMPTSSIT